MTSTIAKVVRKTYLCHVLLRFMLVLNCDTKISEKPDMTKSWALSFAACHKQELFVA